MLICEYEYGVIACDLLITSIVKWYHDWRLKRGTYHDGSKTKGSKVGRSLERENCYLI